MLIGLGTIVLGSSGFIASGAFTFGSQGSVGQNWVQVDDADVDVDPETDAEASPSGETRIQLVTDPANAGNRVSNLAWDGVLSESAFVRGDGDGFLSAIDMSITNRRAVSRIGQVAADGTAGDRAAFLVANVGGVGNPGIDGRTVDLRIDLFDGRTDDPDDAIAPTDQLRFPYRTARASGGGEATAGRGRDLLGTVVRLVPRQILEVAIEVDSRTGTDELDRVGSLGVSVQPVGGRSGEASNDS
ncbi:MAG: hypothetical protein ACQETB_07320 [Halobacteriota archaeon]